MDATWPSTVPADPEEGTYSETKASNLSVYSPRSGQPFPARRATVKHSRIQAGFFMEPGELTAFIGFYRDTLADGARPFRWTNPVYGQESRYLFDPESPPKWEPLGFGAAYRVSLVMLSLGRRPVVPVSGPVWLLTYGIWDDSGIWDDGAVWAD
jgi:hypothetical protein